MYWERGGEVVNRNAHDTGIENYSYNTLVEYFGILVDMEKNRYLQKRLIDTLNERIQRLCIPANIERGDYIREPEVPGKDLLCYMVSGAIAGVVLYLISGFLLDELFDVYLPINFGTIILFMLGTIIVLVSCVLWDNSKHVAEVRLRNKRQVEEYEDKRNRDLERINKEAAVRDELIQIKDRVKKRYSESGETLRKIYSLNICYPKYRDFISVCSIYEYLVSRRCTTLGGPHGAYNLFEYETRQNLIICKLDEVISSLRRIEKSQMVLAHAITESNNKVNELINTANRLAFYMEKTNDKLDGISNGMKSLEEKTAIDIYVSEQAVKELEYLNRMENKIGKYNGVLFNDRY